MEEDEITIRLIEPRPFPDGLSELHADGGGVTTYRLMTREELATEFPPCTKDEGE